MAIRNKSGWTRSTSALINPRSGLIRVPIPFPFSDLSSAKRHPVLVLTPPDRHGDFVCLAVTSVPTEVDAVPITDADLDSGALPKPSWVRLDKVFTLAEAMAVRRFGQLSPRAMARVLEGLCRRLGCEQGSTGAP